MSFLSPASPAFVSRSRLHPGAPNPGEFVSPIAVNDTRSATVNTGPILLNPLVNDIYDETGLPTIGITLQPSLGSAVVVNNNTANANIQYTPPASPGSTSLTYSLSASNNFGIGTAVISIIIDSGVGPPVAEDDERTVLTTQPTLLTVLDNDDFTDVPTLEILTQPSLGSVELVNNGTASADIRYFPQAFAENWNTGSVWSSANWTGIETTGTSVVNINANRGQLNPAGSGPGITGYAYARARAQSGSLSGINLTATFTLGAAGATEQYHALCFRASSTWSAALVPTNGYRLLIYAGNLELAVYSSGAQTVLATVARTWNTSTYNVRIQAIGSAIKVKVWQGTEPGAWDIEVTNSVRNSGIISFASANGATTTARPIFWDDLVVNVAG